MRVAAGPALPRPFVSRSTLRSLAPPAVLILVMAALVTLVPPMGEFPVDDDWDYARAVQTLIEQGRPGVSVSVSASLVLQTYWGGLFAHLFGFSHTTLRISTLVLAGGGALAFYLVLREQLDSERALLGALLLLVNPLYVFLSYSFMTDVPFLSLALWALFCYVRALRTARPRLGWLAAGSALAGGAFLIRQVAGTLPLAALAGLLLTAGWRTATRPRHLLAVLVPFLPAVLYGAYFDAQRGPVRQEPLVPTLAFWAQHGPGLLGVALARLAGAASTLGLFTLPLSLAALGGWPALGLRRWQRRLAVALLFALAAGFTVRIALFRKSPLFPHLSDVITRHGFLISNTTSPQSIVIPASAQLVVTILALVGAALLMVAVAAAFSGAAGRGPAAVVLLFGLLAIGLTVVYYGFYDRYLLPALPAGILAALAFRRPRWGRALALEGAALLVAWCIWWERDYLERQAAVWQAGQALVERGISPEEIDGGYEWDGWFRGNAAIASAAERAQADGAGQERQFNRYVSEGLQMQQARWALVYTLPRDPSTVNVLLAAPYGDGQYVFAIQRY